MTQRSWLLATVAVGATLTVAAPAYAQDTAVAAAPQEPQPTEEVAQEATGGEMTVTGTRVTRDGFQAPTPTTVLTSEALQNRGVTNVGDLVNEIPSFRPSQTNQTNTQSSSASGATFADLRGLGNIRTLTLVDSRRHVPTSATGQVDLNLIPTVLIERIDVVTGGASAAYGSDAISGVVNVVLNRRLDGFRGDVSLGVAEAGDNFERRLSLAFGTEFGDGRGHIVIGGEFVQSDGVSSWEDRDWSRRYDEVVSFANTRPAGTPSRFYSSGVLFVNSLYGGVILGNNADTTPGNGVDVLRGYHFPTPGVVGRFTYGQESGGSSYNLSSSQGVPPRLGHTLVLPIDRRSAIVNIDYELSDSINFFVQAGYARSGSDFSGPIPRDTATTGANALIIRRDNAYLPAEIATIMDANAITSFPLGRANPDISSTRSVNYNTTVRAVAGLNGDLGGGWNWDVYGQYGENEFDSEIRGIRIQQNFLYAIDAIRLGTGQVVCRDTTARAAGCVPLNLFGVGAASAEALAYTNGTQIQKVNISQTVVAGNLRGEPFSTWAGPVSLAAGAEYRVDSAESVVDSIAARRGYNFSNPAPYSGEFEVKEGYAEIVVPLARDTTLLQSLELNGAVRYTDYSSSGGVTTWKVGGTWEPFDGIRFRATRSRDIRAPNSAELFSRISTNATLRNPFNGVSRSYTVITEPSPTLAPEEADTLTLGAVFTPTFFPGFSASVDYYNIDIGGAIASYPAQQILDNCFAETQTGGAGPFCAMASLSGTGAGTEINSVSVRLLNLASLKTEGVDFEMAYRFDALGGRVNARFYGTYVAHLISDDGLGVPVTYNGAGVIQTRGSIIDRAGQVGGFTSGLNTGATSVPHWQLNGSLNYETERFSTTLTGRWIDGGIVDATLVQPGDPDYNPASPISIADMNVASRFYLHWSGSYNVIEDGARRVQVYALINNLLDAEPPFPNTAVAGYYDRLGRSYKVGVRFQF